MTLRELKCLIEAEKEKEKVSDEVLKAAAVLLKVNCSKTQYCFDCLFHVDHSDQGGGCFCGCKLEHGISDFSGQLMPKNWRV